MAVNRSLFCLPRRGNLPVHKVPFPEAGEGETLCMREMAVATWNMLRGAMEKESTEGSSFAYSLLSRTLCDEDGKLLFGSDKDLEANFPYSLRTLKRLVEEALRINDLSDKEKNSPPRSATNTPSANSSA